MANAAGARNSELVPVRHRPPPSSDPQPSSLVDNPDNQVQDAPARQNSYLAPENERVINNMIQNDLANEELVVEVLEIDQSGIDGDTCVICMTEVKNTVFYPCGHMCLC